MDGMSTEAIAAMLIGGLGVVSGVVAYLFRMLYLSGERRVADLQASHAREIAAKDEQIAARDAEIGRLNTTVTQLRDRGSHGRPAGGAT